LAARVACSLEGLKSETANMIHSNEAHPLVVSYGGGTNSSAMLIGLREKGLQTPDLIMFADTGNEKPETYDHLQTMQDWCESVGFPRIIVVRNELPQGLKDGTLYDECYRLGTMPSKLFGYSTCSMKWKVEPQIRFLKQWMEVQGHTFVVHAIGYDADEIHRSEKRKEVRDFERNWYPLIEWDWGRDECVAAIKRAGMPQPGKSACFMCPSSRKPEVIWLKSKHPALYTKAIDLEARALAGEGRAPAARVDGLGRHWNWATFAGDDRASPEVDCGCYDGEPAPEEIA
jgi:hypothetical protein